MNKAIQTNRYFLKDSLRLAINFSLTDQNKGLPPPPLQKPYSVDKSLISLPTITSDFQFANNSIFDVIRNRKSRRAFSDQPLALEELSFLLWATQGIRQQGDAYNALRTVPSAGCRHAFETYLVVSNIHNLAPGIYRYLPIEHSLIFELEIESTEAVVSEATLNQSFVGKAPVTFIWSCIPYRMEWRYDLCAHRLIAIDIGHVCQNLYLACEAIRAGTCAIGAFHQEKMDQLIGVDGIDEFVIYLAPVGKQR